MKKILYIILIVAVVIAGVCVAKKISDGEKTVKTDANIVNNVDNKVKQNEVEENNIVTEPEDSETENNEVDNKETSNLSPEEKAKQLAKDNWGEDSTVYFSFEEVNEEGRYVISVRDKETTRALEWLYIDIETGTIDMK